MPLFGLRVIGLRNEKAKRYRCGGKGRLSSAAKALEDLQLRIPLASLAKRLEEVFLPDAPEPVLLEKDRPALKLLQSLRDEAHRFAVTYHRLLRKKDLFKQ